MRCTPAAAVFTDACFVRSNVGISKVIIVHRQMLKNTQTHTFVRKNSS